MTLESDMAQQSDRFLPANFWQLPREDRQAARAKAYTEYQVWRERRKVEIAAEKAQAAAKSMTCQVCGRAIFAEAGVIAHHGYTRPYEGVQTASCEGAREIPFEVSREVLGADIAHMEAVVVALADHIAAVENETRAIVYAWTSKERDSLGKYREEHSRVTRENFAEVVVVIKANARYAPYLFSFDDIKAPELRRLNNRLEGMQKYVAEQRARFSGWRQTHRAGEPGEGVWMTL
jgi:hypothetical protein